MFPNAQMQSFYHFITEFSRAHSIENTKGFQKVVRNTLVPMTTILTESCHEKTITVCDRVDRMLSIG